MNDAARHPDDTTLFDFIDGALDDAARMSVERHLERCAACEAFVAAARAGTDAIAQNAITMPDDVADRMHVALAGAWRERRAQIAAIEDAADAALVSSDIVEVSFAPGELEAAGVGDVAVQPTPPRTPRRRMRRLVPVLAFVVLAALAGTSIYLGDDSSTAPRSADDEVVEATTAESVDAASDAGGPVSGGASSEAAAPPAVSVNEASRGAGAPAPTGAPTGTSSSLADAAKGAAGAAPPPAATPEPVCVATRDEAQIALPDNRPAQQIIVGPLGIFLACG